jgi:hypothetical protein
LGICEVTYRTLMYNLQWTFRVAGNEVHGFHIWQFFLNSRPWLCRITSNKLLRCCSNQLLLLSCADELLQTLNLTKDENRHSLLQWTSTLEAQQTSTKISLIPSCLMATCIVLCACPSVLHIQEIGSWKLMPGAHG